MRSLVLAVMMVACSRESTSIESPDAGASATSPDQACLSITTLHPPAPPLAPRGSGLSEPAGLALGLTMMTLPLVADLDGDGIRDLAFGDGASVVTLLSTRDFAWSPETVRFFSDPPTALATGDLDGDGRTELLVALASGTIAVRRTDAGLAPLRDVAIGQVVDRIVARDLDRDGHVDLALSVPEWNAVAFVRGRADGSFAPPALFDGNASSGLRVVDLDLDGHLDLLTLPNGGYSLGLLRGRGDGTFAARASIPWGECMTWTRSLDLDGDGESEPIGRSYGDAPRALRVGDGYLAPALLPPGNWSVALDLDGDGKIDLLRSDDTDAPQISLGTGDLTFAATRALDPASGLTFIAASVDANRDGRPDLLGAGSEGVSIALGAGPLRWAPAKPLAETMQPGSFSIGARSSVAVSDLFHPRIILAHLSGRTWSRDADVPAPQAPRRVLLRDLDGDGVEDLLTISASGVHRTFGRKDGGFGPWLPIAEPTGGTLEVADVDVDGKLDLVVTGSGACARIIFDVAGKADRFVDVGGSASGTILRDVDRDGRIDLVCGQFEGLRFLRNTAAGFVEAGAVETTDSLVGLSDLDHDGHDDLVLRDAGHVRTVRGTGAFAFDGLVDMPFSFIGSARLVDLDGDGTDDLCVASSSSNGELLVSRGLSDRTFAAPVSYGLSGAHGMHVFVDADGDGHLDVVSASLAPPSVHVRFGLPR